MDKVIVLNGSGGAGKDTFVEMCSKYCKTKHISSVNKVKTIAKELGWKGDKTEHSRKFLSDLKDLHTNFNDGPFNYIKDQMYDWLLSEKTSRNNILFIDIREPKEILKFVRKANFVVRSLLITNDKINCIKTNHADANVFNYVYDYIIENNGTLEDLENTAKKFVYDLFKHY